MKSHKNETKRAKERTNDERRKCGRNDGRSREIAQHTAHNFPFYLLFFSYLLCVLRLFVRVCVHEHASAKRKRLDTTIGKGSIIASLRLEIIYVFIHMAIAQTVNRIMNGIRMYSISI